MNCLGAKADQPPIFVNRVLLEPRDAFLQYFVYGCFHAKAELNSYDRDHLAHVAEYIYHLTLYRKSVLTSEL